MAGDYVHINPGYLLVYTPVVISPLGELGGGRIEERVKMYSCMELLDEEEYRMLHIRYLLILRYVRKWIYVTSGKDKTASKYFQG